MTKTATSLKFNRYQVIYSRYFDRSFDNRKINEFVAVDDFQNVADSLRQCLETFLKEPTFRPVNWKLEAVNDRVSGEYTPLKEIPGLKTKVNYLADRFNLTFALSWVKTIYRAFPLKPNLAGK